MIKLLIFILVIYLVFKPNLDFARGGSILLWYNSPVTGKRERIILKHSNE